MCECYFYIEPNPKPQIQVLCIECYDNRYKGLYWNTDFGHEKDVICYKCGKAIKKYEKQQTSSI